MDPIAIQVLEDGWRKDAGVLRAATETTRKHLGEGNEGRWAAAAFELNRSFNVLEKSFERLCETFENHFEKSGSYLEKLIERMELEITGIRSAFLPPEARRSVRELKGFRHLIRNADDLELDPGRVGHLIAEAESIGKGFPVWCQTFLDAVRLRYQASS